ncbi:hypothetical protein SAMN04490357_4344 [Streptomyces misionensis]|uniref:Uncharacterized protein n=1 Tax=Streptomyces misionensis TaxID=67331 RepID=A0A1H4ZAG0_9ACTN|nr:hypothetical protein [Streptomyces misionensis]SED27182.1 hypothetical protein SAMN04490357_4344 [Streptomyces misionensis]
MISAPTASAITYCDRSGYTATNEPMERCTSLDNGILSVHQASNGVVGTEYYKKSGSTISAKLGYSRSGTSHYASAVSIGSGQTKRVTWSLGASAYCSNIIGLMSAGSTYQTPTSHC